VTSDNLLLAQFAATMLRNLSGRAHGRLPRFTQIQRQIRAPLCSSRAAEDETPIKKVVAEPAPAAPAGAIEKLFGPPSAIQLTPEEAAAANRWTKVAPYFAVQAVTGSVYAFSIFTAPLATQYGGFAPAASDWTLTQVMPLFTVSAVAFGTCAATMGANIDRMGPRASSAMAGTCWGAGMGLSAVACTLHSLPLLFLGYGVLGGAGWAFGYCGPIGGQLAWFPDKRGTVSGLGMTSFGLGGVAATSTAAMCVNHFERLPEMVGNISDAGVSVVTQGGVRFLEMQGELREVMVASADQALLNAQLSEGGVYLVGTGASGIAETFGVLGAGYMSIQLLGAAFVRTPPEGYWPAGVPKPEGVAGSASEGTISINSNQALRTPQFWCFWGAMLGNATAGLGIIASAKLLMSDCFAVALPHIATGAFCGAFVSGIAASNTLGRLGWGMSADVLGRRNCLVAFGMTAPLCAAIPQIAQLATTQPELGAIPLYGFSAATCGIVMCYGGLFALLPPFLADIYGPKHAGAITGRVLSAYSLAAIAGPMGLAHLRTTGQYDAIEELSAQCDPTLFEATFGATIDKLPELFESNTVSIQSVLQIVPPELGLLDPTASLYTTTFYTMGGMLAGAAVCSAMIKPLSSVTIKKLTQSL